ncbi:alginate export family protein, partial [Bradyrhizobium sp. NBAIM08]|uniref:alginate export family protein n=1 Tax=Bradyrhizobium sp. NBAIM08 TaxID=2793815 RepID=UPI001CD7AA08
ANIVATGLRLEATPSKRWDVFVAYRGLWLASASDSFSTTGVRDAAGNSGRYAGQQLEGRLRYWLVQDGLRLEVNALWLDKGRFLADAPNAPRNGDAAYASVNLTALF